MPAASSMGREPLASAFAASVQEEVYRRLEFPLFCRGVLAADEQSLALGHARDENEKLFRPCLGISKINRAGTGIKLEHADDFAKQPVAVVVEKALRKYREPWRLGYEKPEKGERLLPQCQIEQCLSKGKKSRVGIFLHQLETM